MAPVAAMIPTAITHFRAENPRLSRKEASGPSRKPMAVGILPIVAKEAVEAEGNRSLNSMRRTPKARSVHGYVKKHRK